MEKGTMAQVSRETMRMGEAERIHPSLVTNKASQHMRSQWIDNSNVHQNLLMTLTVAMPKLEPAELVAKHW